MGVGLAAESLWYLSHTPDDPAFFGGYVCANYERAALDCSLGRAELWQLAWNSFDLAFCSEEDRARWQAELSALRPSS